MSPDPVSRPSVTHQEAPLAVPVLDVIHEFEGLGGCDSRCRIRIYRPTDSLPIVVCSEVPTNMGTSVTNYAECLAAEVLGQYLPEQDGTTPPFVWIEHYPDRQPEQHMYWDALFQEAFALVEFAHYSGEHVVFDRKWRRRFGHAAWQHRTRAEVESLIGGRLSDPTSDEVRQEMQDRRAERFAPARSTRRGRH